MLCKLKAISLGVSKKRKKKGMMKKTKRRKIKKAKMTKKNKLKKHNHRPQRL